jgi:hypothetical protein
MGGNANALAAAKMLAPDDIIKNEPPHFFYIERVERLDACRVRGIN